VAKVDLVKREVMGYLTLKMPTTRLKDKPVPQGLPDTEICTSKKGMPQDIRVSPDGKRFYVADMEADGVHVLDAEAFKEIGFITTGVAAHGLYPSRDGKNLYVANRGSHRIHGPRKGPGSVTVVDSPPIRSWPAGRCRAAAAPTWATSAPMASGCGSQGVSTMWSIASTPPQVRSRRSRWVPSHTA
jgi:hypothetical protein